jgi:hypothetical protein
MEQRGRFLLEYIALLLGERIGEEAGFRHLAPSADAPVTPHADARVDARRRERWVINKLRALCSWYSKGLDGGSSLRVRINAAENLNELRDIISEFFTSPCGSDIPHESLGSGR